MRLGAQAQEEQRRPGPVFRLQSRRGPQKAICAVAASLLTPIHHILKHGTEHRDLGADHFQGLSATAQPSVWSPSSPGSATRCNCNRSWKRHDSRHGKDATFFPAQRSNPPAGIEFVDGLLRCARQMTDVHGPN
jgi:hypothetical protein